MSFELQAILESKLALRRDLASRPIAEKLQMLDEMRERELAIRGGATDVDPRHRPSVKATFVDE